MSSPTSSPNVAGPMINPFNWTTLDHLPPLFKQRFLPNLLSYPRTASPFPEPLAIPKHEDCDKSLPSPTTSFLSAISRKRSAPCESPVPDDEPLDLRVDCKKRKVEDENKNIIEKFNPQITLNIILIFYIVDGLISFK